MTLRGGGSELGLILRYNADPFLGVVSGSARLGKVGKSGVGDEFFRVVIAQLGHVMGRWLK